MSDRIHTVDGLDLHNPDGDRYFRVSEDLKLRYRTAGHGETALIFVPGWTMSC